MLGYQKGIKIRTEKGNITTIKENNLKKVGEFKEICDIQNTVNDLYPNEYDDETSFDIASAAHSILKTENTETIYAYKPKFEAIENAIENGFFPKKEVLNGQ